MVKSNNRVGFFLVPLGLQTPGKLGLGEATVPGPASASLRGDKEASSGQRHHPSAGWHSDLWHWPTSR
jgi:hypothetical protein